MFKSLAVAMLVGFATAAPVISIDEETRTFRDENGRARIFHGQNVVVKLPPYIPDQEKFDFDMSMSTEDLVNLRDWGVKIIRLGVMWESVEREPGVYDMEYLDQIDALVNKFADYGIVTLVDNHQDMFSRRLCGEGVPVFYQPWDNIDHKCPFSIIGTMFRIAGRCVPIDDYDLQYDESGVPLTSSCSKQNFEDMYTAPEVASSFEALYQNQDGLLDKMFDFWGVVATRLKSNPNIIGYDILNEPWPANLYHDASLFFKPTKFDREILYPVAKRAHDEIRNIDDEKFIFFEPAQFPDSQPFLGGFTLPIGFPDSPGGQEYANRQVLNDHSYCCQAAGSMCDSGEPPLSKSQVCRDFHFQKVAAREKDAVRFGVPMMFTEFGACFDGLECQTEITNSADAFDSQLSSWAYWMYKSFGDFTTTGGVTEGMYQPDGKPQPLKLQAIARTYAHAFQGTPESMYFSTANIGTDQPQDAGLITQFKLDKDVTAPTEIYLHKQLFYSEGFKLVGFLTKSGKAIEGLTFETTDESNYIQAVFDDAASKKHSGESVTILLTKAITEMEGSRKENGYDLSHTVSDLGASATCEFKTSFADRVPANIAVHVLNRDGDRLIDIGADDKAQDKSVTCSDLVDGKILLVANPTCFTCVTKVLTELPTTGLNGTLLTFNIDIDETSQPSEPTSFISKLWQF